MKLLRINVQGAKFFKDDLEINFYAKQRVNKENKYMLTSCFSNIYVNNVIAFTGINASGKTSILNTISFVIQMLNNKPLNEISSKIILDRINLNDSIIFETYFTYDNQSVHKIRTIVKKDFDIDDAKEKYIIIGEKIWEKPVKSINSKKDLFIFEEKHLIRERKNDEMYLSEDVSLIIGLNKTRKTKMYFYDSLDITDVNLLKVIGTYPLEIVNFLDPTIEYLKVEDNDDDDFEMKLKFKSRDEITLSNPASLHRYLSSGTIKGLSVFVMAMLALNRGGYLVIDELENHFNKEIVSTLIRFFMEEETNSRGATMIFSTHYIELLDQFERNDNVYIVKNNGSIFTNDLSEYLKRNDLKKSEILQSDYLEGTAPQYEQYMKLKKRIIAGSKVEN